MTCRGALTVVALLAAAATARAQQTVDPRRHYARTDLPTLPARADAPPLGIRALDGTIQDDLPLPGFRPPEGNLARWLAEALHGMGTALAEADQVGGLTVRGTANDHAAAAAAIDALRAASRRTWRVTVRVLPAPDAVDALATLDLDVVEGGGAAAAHVSQQRFVWGYDADVEQDAVGVVPQHATAWLGLSTAVECVPHPVDPAAPVLVLRLSWGEPDGDPEPLRCRAGVVERPSVRCVEVATAVRVRDGERCVAGATSAEVAGAWFQVTAQRDAPTLPAGAFVVFPVAAVIEPLHGARALALSASGRGDPLADDGPAWWEHGRGEQPTLPEWPAAARVGPWLVADATAADLAAIRAALAARVERTWRPLRTASRVRARTPAGDERVLAEAELPGLAGLPAWVGVRRERPVLADYEVEVGDRAIGTQTVTRVLRTGYVHAVDGPADGPVVRPELVTAHHVARRVETFHGPIEQPTVEWLATEVAARPGRRAWGRDAAGSVVTLEIDAPPTVPDPWALLAEAPRLPEPSALDPGPTRDWRDSDRMPGLGEATAAAPWVAGWEWRTLRERLALTPADDAALARAAAARLTKRAALSVRVVRLDGPAAAALGAVAPHGLLEDAALVRLRALERAGGVRELGAGRAELAMGSRAAAAQTTSRPVIGDYDMEVAQDPETRVPDPIAWDWTWGTAVAARAWPSIDPERFLVELDLQHAAPIGEPARFPTMGGEIEQPATAHASVGAVAWLAPGETWCALAGGPGAGEARVAFLVTLDAPDPSTAGCPGFGVWPLVELCPPVTRAQAPALGGPVYAEAPTAVFDDEGCWPPADGHDTANAVVDAVARLLPRGRAGDVWSNGRVLVVRGGPAELARIDAWLRTLAARSEPRALRATLWALTDAELARVGAGGAPRGEMAAVLACTATDGRWAHASRGLLLPIVSDYDVEVASAGAIADPIADALREGFTFEARPMLAPDGSTLVVDCAVAWASADRPFRTIDGGHGPIQAPASETGRWEGRVALSPRAPLWVPLGRRADGRHRVLAIEATWRPPPPLPAGWLDGGLAGLSPPAPAALRPEVADGTPSGGLPDTVEVAGATPRMAGDVRWLGRFAAETDRAAASWFAARRREGVEPRRLRVRALRHDTLLAETALWLAPGVWAAAETGRTVCVLADRDLEVAWRLALSDPVMRATWTGLAVSAQLATLGADGRARVEFRGCGSEPGPLRAIATPIGAIELTRAAGTEVEAVGDLAPDVPWRVGAAGEPHAVWFELVLDSPAHGAGPPATDAGAAAVRLDVEWRAGATVLAAAATGAVTGGVGRIAVIESRTEVVDAEAEVAQEAAASDPVVRALASGTWIEFRPLCVSASGVLCDLRVRRGAPADCWPTVSTPAGVLTLPRQPDREHASTLHCPLGEWVDVPWGTDPQGGRVMLRIRASQGR